MSFPESPQASVSSRNPIDLPINNFYSGAMELKLEAVDLDGCLSHYRLRPEVYDWYSYAGTRWDFKDCYCYFLKEAPAIARRFDMLAQDLVLGEVVLSIFTKTR